jgi:aminoglycoside 6'-N-acetyltransferase
MSEAPANPQQGAGAMQAVAFRALHVDDMQQVFLWLIRPHVSKWYAPMPSSFAEVVAKYGPRTLPGNAVRAFIVTLDGAEVGYIQAYAVDVFPDYSEQLGCERGVAGIDLFIGEEALLSRGIGAQVVRRFVDEVVFGAMGAHACIAGPDDGNAASIRAFEKAGFQRWKVVRIDDERSECVLRRERGA